MVLQGLGTIFMIINYTTYFNKKNIILKISTNFEKFGVVSKTFDYIETI